MASLIGAGVVSSQVTPPSLVRAKLLETPVPFPRSPPPRMPCFASWKAMLNPPAGGPETSGVGYAFHVLPPSLVAITRAGVAPPVVNQARFPPCVVMQVPLDANPASAGNAGVTLSPISCQVWPLVVRRIGKRPFTESLIAKARLLSQKAKQS